MPLTLLHPRKPPIPPRPSRLAGSQRESADTATPPTTVAKLQPGPHARHRGSPSMSRGCMSQLTSSFSLCVITPSVAQWGFLRFLSRNAIYEFLRSKTRKRYSLIGVVEFQ
ncbi:hypothetical protein AAHA92_05105 [Salvia divinorum]|uniref:Uncharacterized protein n=1 Tax=Salvia divinorum TaxID=28513 RepID=A0ABD1I2K5_SALDI